MSDRSESSDDAPASHPAASLEAYRMPSSRRWRCTHCEAFVLLLYRRRSVGRCATCGGSAMEALD